MVPDGLRILADLPDAGNRFSSSSDQHWRGMTGWTNLVRGETIREPALSGEMVCTGEAETQVVVAIARGVVVAIGGARVVWVVVPAAAPFHPVGALWAVIPGPPLP